MLREITHEIFQEEIQSGLVLVDFMYHGCQPCLQLLPVLEELQMNFPDVKVLTIDAINNRELSMSLEINAYPTMVLYKDGVMIEKRVGGRSIENLTRWIQQNK